MNLPRRAVVRPLTSCLAAVALAATAFVPVAASAAPAPAGRSGAVASSVATAAASVTARTVTPPTAVTKKQLVRIFRAAARATDAGLRRGASLRTVQEIKGQRTVGTGRALSGRLVVRDSAGSASILDVRTGSAYVSIAGVVNGIGVSKAELEAALTALGKPGATWAEMAGAPPKGGLLGQSLVTAAKAATSWTWQRSKGVTTWRLTSTKRLFGATTRTTQVVVLDARQRLVRQVETTKATALRGAVRSTLIFRYRPVAPITLPTPAQTVGFAELLRQLMDAPDAG